MSAVLSILLVDDEAPARLRLRDLLGDIAGQVPNTVIAEAEDGVAAIEACMAQRPDVVLTDIRMPRMDGIELAQHLGRLPQPPAIIFLTAYDQYAVRAFDLAAVDYLLKPVRAERLAAALEKARTAAIRAEQLQALAPQGRRTLRSSERGRTLLIPVNEIVYLRAEQKYVTARTHEREYLIEESLSQLEQELADLFIRAHRNCLVARAAIVGYERGSEDGESDGHQLLLAGIDERVIVSRRQWPQVKALLK